MFTDVRAPSTLGTFLRVFTFGHVRQLDAVAAALLARLTSATPILADPATVAFLDLDDTVRQPYGYAKQGAGRGCSGVKGLTNSVRGAAKLLAGVLATAARAGVTALVIVRADSAFYSYPIIAATHQRRGAPGPGSPSPHG